MKRIITVLFLFLCYSSPAQKFYAGAGLEFSNQSSGAWITDSLALATTNTFGRKYIIPHMGMNFSINEKVSAQAEVAYRRHTISLQYWNNRADTCRLCPVKKGGGPGIDEFRFAGRLNYRVMNLIPCIFLTAGVTANIPFNVQGNASILPEDYQALAIAAEGIRTGSYAYELGIMIQYKFLQFSILSTHNPAYTRSFEFMDEKIPFRTSERMWQYRLSLQF